VLWNILGTLCGTSNESWAKTTMNFTVLEMCAGAGGQALGLERAGFSHCGAIEIDKDACKTLRLNRPDWHVVEGDLRTVSGKGFKGTDLLAGGVPCPPFSIAGKQLGHNDERDLFPEALRLAAEVKPTAVMLENVPGFASRKFEDYRRKLLARLTRLGYECGWQVVNASAFGVPQLRPRFILVAMRPEYAKHFVWPSATYDSPTVGETLKDLMGARKWKGVKSWAVKASGIAPTLVGGSKKHGGPDLGPTRAREQWKKLHVDGLGLADLPPAPDFPSDGLPRLTVRMAARIQGFPDNWQFSGAKTTSYRQVGNAFPPPVACAVGTAIRAALTKNKTGSAHQTARLEAVAMQKEFFSDALVSGE